MAVEGLAALLDVLSRYIVAAMVAGILAFGLVRRVPVYDSFVRGARSGLAMGLRLVPYMVAMLTATELFRASGAMDAFASAAGPVGAWLGVPPAVLPMALLRPMSGSAATAFLAFLLKTYGPDSLVGRMASVMEGSTETTLYVVTVYLGSVGIRDPRWSLAAGLIADLASFIGSAAISHLFWGASAQPGG